MCLGVAHLCYIGNLNKKRLKKLKRFVCSCVICTDNADVRVSINYFVFKVINPILVTLCALCKDISLSIMSLTVTKLSEYF